MREKIVLLVLVLFSGCVCRELFFDKTTTTLPDLMYLLDDVPKEYSSGVYSVEGFIEESRGLMNTRLTIRGVVYKSYSCPPCPPGASCAPCPVPRITLIDPIPSGKTVVLDFGVHRQLAEQLDVGEEVEVTVIYREHGDVEAESVEGCLTFFSLKKTGRRFDLSAVGE